jgi:hypothetical protein
MRNHYDFSTMKARRNPYAKMIKQPVTIRLDQETVAHFKALAVKTGLPYQSLINLYLRDCAARGKEPSLRWARARPRGKRASRKRRTRVGGKP